MSPHGPSPSLHFGLAGLISGVQHDPADGAIPAVLRPRAADRCGPQGAGPLWPAANFLTGRAAAVSASNLQIDV